jgi:hypothetical protein
MVPSVSCWHCRARYVRQWRSCSCLPTPLHSFWSYFWPLPHNLLSTWSAAARLLNCTIDLLTTLWYYKHHLLLQVLVFEHCLIAVGAEPRPLPEGYTDAAAQPRVVPLHGAAVREAALWLLLRGGDVAILGSSWAALEMACHLRQVFCSNLFFFSIMCVFIAYMFVAYI